MKKSTPNMPLLLLLVAALLGLTACEQPLDPSDNQTDYGSLSGLVLDQETESPVAAAVVTALINAVTDTTDTLGIFLLDSLALGIDTIMVTAALYDTAYSAILVIEGPLQDTIYLPAEEPVELNTQVIASFTTPGPSPRGLTWDGAFLWLGDDSTNNIYKINPAGGLAVDSVSYYGSEPRGVAFDGSHLWSLDNGSGKIYGISADNGALTDSIDLHFIDGLSFPSPPGGLTGIAWEEDYLWISIYAGWSSKAYKIDVLNSRINFSFYSDVDDLTFDGKYLWCLDSQNGHSQGFVKKYDITDGKQLAYFLTPENLPTGLAFDGTNFWIADDGVDTLFRISD